MTACTQPGCTGNILDGYCDVCGSPAAAPASAPASARTSAAPIGAAAGKCTQPDCGGTIVDGYCDVCGSPGAAARPLGNRRRLRDWLDRLACIEPARFHGPGLRAHRGHWHQDHPPRRHLLHPPARRPAGCGTDVDPGGAGRGRGPGDPGAPDGAGGAPQLPQLRVTGRAVPRRTARAHRGLLPQVPQPVLVHPQAPGRRPGRRAVRGRRGTGTRRSRLDLRRARPQRVQPLGRPQGSAELRRPGRARRRHRRTTVPRAGRAPPDPRDLQLRDARGRRLHRDGVRRRHLAQAAAAAADESGRREVRPAPGRPGDRLRGRGPARVPVPPRPQPDLLRLQAGQHHPGRRRGQADRPRRRTPPRRPRLGDLRDDGIPGAGGADRRAVGGLRHLHDRTHPDGAVDGVPRLPEHLRRLVAAGRPDSPVPGARLVLPAAAQGLRPRPCGPVRLGRRAPRAAARRTPRGGGAPTRGRSGALHVLAAVLVADGLRRRALLAGPARPPRRRERSSGAVVADGEHRGPGRTTCRTGGRPRGQSRGPARQVTRRPGGRPATTRPTARHRSCCPTTPGNGVLPG